MKKILCSLLIGGAALFANAQQIQGDFSNFEAGYNTVGHQPLGWKGSNVNQTVKVIIIGDQTKKEPLIFQEESGVKGNAVKMINKFVGVANIGSNAPAYISLGTPWVYAVSKISDCDGGTTGGISFNYRPDAIRGYIKRTLTDNSKEVGNIIVYSWKGSTTYSRKVSLVGNGTPQTRTLTDRERDVLRRDAVATYSSDFKLISKTEYSIPAENLSEWTEVNIPLEYLDTEAVPEKINVIISSADYFNRSNIGTENTLYADEFQFVYYSQLESLAYNGIPLSGFNKDTYTYAVDAGYDAAKIAAFANGKGASVITRYNELTGICTVRVEGQDISLNPSNFHEYKIQFNSTLNKDFENTLSVSINGVGSQPLLSTINLKKESDGEYSLALNNFYFAGVLGIGNIYMKGLTVTEEGSITRFVTNQVIQIAPGDDPDVEWMGPMLGDVPVILEATHKDGKLVAEIDIDMTSTLGQVIHVTFAPELIINDTEAFASVSAGLYNVTLNRSFKSGWNTICLPFATTPEAIAAGNNGVHVQGFTSYDANGLNFSVVEEMQANTPYLVYYLMDLDGPIYLSGNVVAAEPIEVTHGDFTLVGTYEPMSMSGLYGVAKVGNVNKLIQGGANATINGTRAYFKANTPNVKNVKVNFEGETVDAVGGVEVDGTNTYDIYTLSGVQIRKGAASLKGLNKDIYIVNGKKMIIK